MSSVLPELTRLLNFLSLSGSTVVASTWVVRLTVATIFHLSWIAASRWAPPLLASASTTDSQPLASCVETRRWMPARLTSDSVTSDLLSAGSTRTLHHSVARLTRSPSLVKALALRVSRPRFWRIMVCFQLRNTTGDAFADETRKP